MKQYSVMVQCKYQERGGEWSPIAPPFSTKADAKKALHEFIKKRNRGARTERQAAGQIGILCEIDENTASDLAVVHWKIKCRSVTPWELVDEA